MKEKLVLHICCAPDEAFVVNMLGETYALQCFFSNPNIQPKEEYLKRLEEAAGVAEKFNVPFDAPAYEPRLWEQAVSGLEDSGEGGERCRRCFLLRFLQTAEFCADKGYGRFSSVMSISPHKRITMLNETGAEAAARFGIEYIPFNFKKNDGFQKSVLLSRRLGLYRQDYCGCRLSKAESIERKNRLASKNISKECR
jgi:hypothetical protein